VGTWIDDGVVLALLPLAEFLGDALELRPVDDDRLAEDVRLLVAVGVYQRPLRPVRVCGAADALIELALLRRRRACQREIPADVEEVEVVVEAEGGGGGVEVVVVFE
jgi:hypothetical protein